MTPAMRAARVGDIMSAPVVTTSPSETIAEAAARMDARRVGSVVVVDDNGRPIGILTERDLVRFVASGAGAATASVSEYMTPDPDTTDPSEEVIDAFRQLAAHGYRHLPVVSDGRLVGIVSMRDLLLKLQRGPAVLAAEPSPVGPFEANRTLLTLLETGQASDPAIVVPGGQQLTYATFRAAVQQMADRLATLGIQRGDRVAVVLPHGPEAIVATLGAALAASAAPLNPSYTEDEFRFYLADVSAGALLVPFGGAQAARGVWRREAPLVELALDPRGELRIESAPAGRSQRTADNPTPDDVALVLHSSGTTGRPKRAPLRHRNLVASAGHTVATYALRPSDVTLAVMPLFHVHGLLGAVLATLASGGTVVVPPRLNPLGFWRLVKTHRVTWYTAVPTIHQLVLARCREGERPPGAETLRFIRSASAKLRQATVLGLEARLGLPVLEAYGMTEAAHQIASNPLPPAPRAPGSVGLGTGVRLGVMDEQGDLLTLGASGEVVIQGPNVIDGYDNNPEADAAAFTKGWFRTGDLGVLDASGYLTLVGRLKEMINRGGEKISPHEIEEVLLMHPGVAEAVCFGVPHPSWGEEVAAMVVPRAPVAEAELLRHCRKHLAEFKVPKWLREVDAIPRGATGKVQRAHLATLVGVAP